MHQNQIKSVKQFLAIILFFLIAYRGLSQDTVIVYMNQNYEAVQKENAMYVREAVVAGDHFYITDKLADGTVYNYYELSSLDPQIYDVLAVAYDSNYNIYAKGKYKENVMSGQWVYFDEAGMTDTVYYPEVTADDEVHKAKFYKKSRKTKEIGYNIIDSLSYFLKSNFHLPPRAREMNNKFSVEISCVIDKSGQPSGHEVLLYNPSMYHIFDTNAHLRIEKVMMSDYQEDLHQDVNQEIARVINLFRYSNRIRKPIGISFIFSYGYPETKIETNQVYTVVEEMPEFKSTRYRNNLFLYVRKKLSGQFADCSGRVYVHFIVEKDGSIKEVGILKGIENCNGYEEELRRILQNCPPWKPGKQRGKPIRVAFNMPVLLGVK